MEILLIACGCFWILLSFLTNTKNVRSAIVFRVIPFATGVAVCLVAMDLLCVINLFPK